MGSVGRALFSSMLKLASIGGAAEVKEAEAKVDVDPKSKKRSLASIDADAESQKRARGAENTRNCRARQQAAVVDKLKAAVVDPDVQSGVKSLVDLFKAGQEISKKVRGR